jgi:hypothetical protein
LLKKDPNIKNIERKDKENMPMTIHDTIFMFLFLKSVDQVWHPTPCQSVDPAPWRIPAATIKHWSILGALLWGLPQ